MSIRSFCRRPSEALSALVVLAALAVPASASPDLVYVTVDQAQIMPAGKEPFSKVVVTNPAIADVVVISPTQLLLSGKTEGVTSLVVFYSGRVEHFNLVVHPAPATQTRNHLLPAENQSVLIQRGNKVSQHLFVRDEEQAWVELGNPKAETEVAKK